ncbi:MAG: trypsin-like peptidase domain-containing protein [Bacteroidetes bacterium]|nr:trypsin-like peptidase domain-containing protein [Bacteroidota bacterium]
MKYFILFSILIPSICLCQNLKESDLKKYSYVLLLVDTPYNANDSFMSGTGFILRYKDSNYLVTNYHILTGKESVTDKYNFVNGKPVVPRKVIVLFKIKNTREFFQAVFSLYDKNGIPLYKTLPPVFQSRHDDVAIMPFNFSNPYLEINVIDYSMCDTSDKKWNNEELITAGFPHLQTDSDRYAKVFKGHSITPPFTQVNHPYIYTDISIEKGASGSPIYTIDKNGTIKVIAVLSDGEIDVMGKKVNSAGPYFKYVLKLLNQ